jgi:hypothetical protein
LTRITNAEQVLLLLRSHLQRSQRARKKDVAPAAGGRNAERKSPLERVQQMAIGDGLSNADAARALIAGLLAEEFGSAVAADPKFQQMVDDVRQIIERDEAGAALVKKGRRGASRRPLNQNLKGVLNATLTSGASSVTPTSTLLESVKRSVRRRLMPRPSEPTCSSVER